MQNRIVELRKVARALPQSSGVYLMKDRLGHVIYVGKAKNLRRRVGAIFRAVGVSFVRNRRLLRWWRWFEKWR